MQQPVKLCMLATDVDAGGGVARQAYGLLDALGSLGVRSFLLARNYSSKPRSERVGNVAVRRSPVVGRIRPVNSALYLSDVVSWLVRHRTEYDIVHCQQMSGPAMAALIAKRLTGRPVLVRVTSCGPEGEIAEAQRMVFTRTRRALLGDVDRWVALTNEMKEELIQFGADESRVAVIPNGTRIPLESAQNPSDRAAARSRLGLGTGGVVVYSGRLSSEKGLDVLLHAWVAVERQHPDTQLIILGEGGVYRNVEGEIRELAAALALKRVRFYGHVSNVGEFLVGADVFVLPSRTEGMSNSLVEAMAAGVAIVASDIPANLEVLSHDHTGLLFRVNDSDDLALGINRLLAEPLDAQRLGRSARQKAEKDLSVSAMADSYMRQYVALREGSR